MTVALSPDLDVARLARTVAANAQRILSGTEAGQIEVAFAQGEHLTTNVATVRAIDKWPSFQVLTEADLLNEDVARTSRRLSLFDAVHEATEVNLDLAAAGEREHGTIEHLLVMPVTPFEIMMAKVWTSGLVVWVGAALSLRLVVQGVLDVPIAGSIPLFLFGAMLRLFSTTSMGIFMATVARSIPQFGLLLILVILPLQMLSGGVTPRESMPEIVQTIMLGAPTTHFTGLALAILYRGAGFDVVWPQFAAIVGIGIVYFTGALLRFRASVAAQS